MIKPEILAIADEAFLKITNDSDTLVIGHRFSFKDQLNWFVLLFFTGGLWIISIPFWTASAAAQKIESLIFGSLLIAVAIYAFVMQRLRSVSVNKDQISYVFNFRYKTIASSSCREVVMKVERIRYSGKYSNTILVCITHYLRIADDREVAILSYVMDDLHADKAIKLGGNINQKINQRMVS